MWYTVFRSNERGLTTMTITEIINIYNIRDGATMGKPGAIYIANAKQATKDNMLDEIKARKPEILKHFADERARKEAEVAERKAKIDAIPGLKEINAAIDDLAAWRREFNASFDDVGGLGVRAKPEYDLDAMMAQYPQAAAYIKAEEYAHKTNYELSSIGKRALEGVINGNWEEAIDQMNKELKAFTDRHFWD